MCGICGFIGPGNEDDLIEMTETLVHRGPDESGYYWNEGIGIGHRRLNIIDLAGGKQPMYNEDKKLVVTYNGEIYNFRSLKKLLTVQFKKERLCGANLCITAFLFALKSYLLNTS